MKQKIYVFKTFHLKNFTRIKQGNYSFLLKKRQTYKDYNISLVPVSSLIPVKV